MESSILASIGCEIVGVMSPVSICMLLVVLLVYSLSSSSSSSAATQIRTAANLVYLEDASDSVSQKLEGALLNALVFVLLITLLTFLLVLLYYFRFTSFLKNYMRFSAFFVFASMGGSIFLSLILHFSIPIDSLTSFLLLFNFSVVGVLSLFSAGFPIIWRQSYMVSLGIFVATWFTRLPEWTTWSLLVALALYDLVAVLAPGGPLKLLVELASSRDEELPALVYEARPTVPREAEIRGPPLGLLVSDSGNVELQAMPRDSASRENLAAVDEEDDEGSPLVGNGGDPSSEYSTVVARSSDENGENASGGGGGVAVDEEMSPLVEVMGMGNEREATSSRGIKLGLGDFIFYSVLVGRAAMYDLMTVYACYLAIISGLGCTLILLSVYRRALPALPISIALGVVFYFLTRLLMEPFVVGTATNLLMF
ncbi:Presenilin-like protein [Morus notabilis]|uniref:Presenilin n=1 Tax=Morus notabilis TaxID=981085 RepID=W9RSH1_9ROSA|nr:presenilin-like protein At1g08700 [Morus notabilis]XP_024025546.1 presenilin-like protein At1g08700 [Morus notabilis]XP_024025547.1 presenilin-like protein At1g08700 [Morus notabilis]XP_024025548.1 presenilin-like protein At1g08700 [Morus notabilis]EXB94288.1 Presenilin-like protein [Morus notabilis]